MKRLLGSIVIVCMGACNAGTLPEGDAGDASSGADSRATDAAAGADSSLGDTDASPGDSGGEAASAADGPTPVEAGPVDAAGDTASDAPVDGAAADAPGDGPADSAPAWSPLSLSNLVLWLDGHVGLGTGSIGDSGPALVWRDQSGQHNDALGIGTPAADASGVDGQPSVHLNGRTDYLLIQDSPSLEWGTGDFTVAAVLQYRIADGAVWGYGAIYSKQEAASPFIGPAMFGYPFLSGQVDDYQGDILTTTVTGLNDGVPILAVFQRTGDELSLSVNGSNLATATGSQFAEDASAAGYPVHIGGTSAGQDLLGDIAEVVAFKGPLAGGDLLRVESYLMTKYSLGVD